MQRLLGLTHWEILWGLVRQSLEKSHTFISEVLSFQKNTNVWWEESHLTCSPPSSSAPFGHHHHHPEESSPVSPQVWIMNLDPWDIAKYSLEYWIGSGSQNHWGETLLGSEGIQGSYRRDSSSSFPSRWGCSAMKSHMMFLRGVLSAQLLIL